MNLLSDTSRKLVEPAVGQPAVGVVSNSISEESQGYKTVIRTLCNLSHFNLVTFGTSVPCLLQDRPAFCISEILSGLCLLLIVFTLLLFCYVFPAHLRVQFVGH